MDRGPSPVFLSVGSQRLRLPDAFRVDESNGLRPELLSEVPGLVVLP